MEGLLAVVGLEVTTKGVRICTVATGRKRCYVGLVAVGVEEQAEDILVPPLLRNCLTLNYISFS